ncbi:hypothetical protein ACROYT_G020334 [Oculina patagonica]
MENISGFGCHHFSDPSITQSNLYGRVCLLTNTKCSKYSHIQWRSMTERMCMDMVCLQSRHDSCLLRRSSDQQLVSPYNIVGQLSISEVMRTKTFIS